jgi:hypothetical protein
MKARHIAVGIVVGISLPLLFPSFSFVQTPDPGRDPKTIMRTVNLVFYLRVDARGCRARRRSSAATSAPATVPTAPAICVVL